MNNDTVPLTVWCVWQQLAGPAFIPVGTSVGVDERHVRVSHPAPAAEGETLSGRHLHAEYVEVFAGFLSFCLWSHQLLLQSDLPVFNPTLCCTQFPSCTAVVLYKIKQYPVFSAPCLVCPGVLQLALSPLRVNTEQILTKAVPSLPLLPPDSGISSWLTMLRVFLPP